MANQKPELSKQQILESIGRIVSDGEGRDSGHRARVLPPEAEPAPAARPKTTTSSTWSTWWTSRAT